MIRFMLVLVLSALSAALDAAEKEPPPKNYAACRAAVESGKSATVAIGVDAPADYHSIGVEGMTPGVYDCFPGSDGLPKMRLRTAHLPAGVVIQPTGYLGAPSTGLAQSKAEIQARAGRCYHPGGSFGGGTAEGCGFSSVSADDAIRHCCFWGKKTPIDIGVARGAYGWHACVIYK